MTHFCCLAIIVSSTLDHIYTVKPSVDCLLIILFLGRLKENDSARIFNIPYFSDKNLLFMQLFVYYQQDQHYADYEYCSSLLGHVIHDEFWFEPVLHWHHLYDTIRIYTFGNTIRIWVFVYIFVFITLGAHRPFKDLDN